LSDSTSNYLSSSVIFFPYFIKGHSLNTSSYSKSMPLIPSYNISIFDFIISKLNAFTLSDNCSLSSNWVLKSPYTN
jgi:hypothetical protein